MAEKPTWKSTEFWLSSLGIIGGLVLSVLPETPLASVFGSLLAAVCGSSYTIGRSMVKAKGESGRAIAKTLLEKKSGGE